MQNAGEAVAREITRRWSPRAVTVLCGPGNNGGDGFVVAVALAQAGWPVRVALLGHRENLRGDARVACSALERQRRGRDSRRDRWRGAGGRCPVWVRPEPRDWMAQSSPRWAPWRNARLPLVAVDVPSGVMGDTGESLGAAPAACTVTFARKKPRSCLVAGPRAMRRHRGRGHRHSRSRARIAVASTPGRTIPPCGARNCRRRSRRATNTRAAMRSLCGGYPMTGAARMAARAAARVGAGLTTIAVPEAAFSAVCRGPHQHHGAALGARAAWRGCCPTRASRRS